MRWLNILSARLRALLRREQVAQDIEEELRIHLEMEALANIERGIRPDEAGAAARNSFGNFSRINDLAHEIRGGGWMDSLIQDLRYGLRQLLKSKGFTAIAVLSLALGVGANTAIFSIIDILLLKSLPVQEPEKLVLFGNGRWTGNTDDFPNQSMDLFSYPFFKEARNRNEVFRDVAALESIHSTVHGRVNEFGVNSELESMDVQLVSGNFFQVLGVHARFGRVFNEADDQNPGGHPVLIVSHAWWERRLGKDPAAVGKTITIDRTTYTIVGVAPEEFFGVNVGEAPDLWAPLAMQAQTPPEYSKGRKDKSFQSLYLIARLKDGVSAGQAGAAINLLFKQSLQEWAGAHPSAEQVQNIQRATIELTPAARGLSHLRREFSLSLRILMAVAGAVLLIACANVANLLLARAAARRREFAVRLAIGAGRIRLVRQLLTESLLLAGLCGVAGIALAWMGSRLLILMASNGPDPLPLDVTPNPRVLSFTLFASLLSALVFGVAPAFRASRIDPNSALKDGKGAAQAISQSPFGKALVVVQIALSLVLLVGACLFVRTLINLQNVPTGFNQANVFLFKIDTAATGLQEDAGFASLLREVEQRVMAEPGVQAASFSSTVFNEYCCWTSSAYVSGQALPKGTSRTIRNNLVGPEYFNALGIPLVLGRVFGPQDMENSRKVAVISESMAQRLFPQGSPLGERFSLDGPDSREQIVVIGVVKDARYERITESLRPMAYYPHSQHVQPIGGLLVRFSGSPAAAIPQVRQAIKQVNRNLPIVEVLSLSDHISRSLVRQNMVARIASFFGVLALALSCIGLYGLLSYGVVRRTNEIGVRMALGAQQGDVLWMVMREAFTLTGGGLIIGLVAASYATQVVSRLLFGLKPTDAFTLAGTTLLLAAVASLAAYLPARRAARVDPMTALRAE
jgi:macrolide transport system ATP-binding/permease protein